MLLPCMGENKSLEAVQKFAMRVCSKQWSSNYNALLNAYGVPSLRKRRLILKLSYLYNIPIVNGRYSLPEPFPVVTPTLFSVTLLACGIPYPRMWWIVLMQIYSRET